MTDLHFFCVICGSALTARLEAAGGLIECAVCRRVVPVPGSPVGPGEVAGCLGLYQPAILEVSIKFLCPECNAKLSADARREGRQVECPHCATKFPMPMWSTPKVVVPEAKLSAAEIEFLSDLAEARTG